MTKNVLPVYFVQPTFFLLVFIFTVPCATMGVPKQVRDFLEQQGLNTANKRHLDIVATTPVKVRRV